MNPTVLLDRRQLREALHGRSAPTAAAAPLLPQPASAPGVGGSTITVVGAHPWAGASTVALAVADVASAHGPVVLRDEHTRDRSGLLAVSHRDLGVRPDGALVGQRGPLEVYTASTAIPDHGGSGMAVRDAGVATGPITGDAGPVVLVCRATIPGFQAAEVALSRLAVQPGGVVLAAVGVRRVPGVVRGSAGPAVNALCAAGRVVCVDHDRRLAVEGLDERPLPASVLASGRRILRVLVPDLEPTLPKRSVR